MLGNKIHSILVTEQPAIGGEEGGKMPEVATKVSALGDLFGS